MFTRHDGLLHNRIAVRRALPALVLAVAMVLGLSAVAWATTAAPERSAAATAEAEATAPPQYLYALPVEPPANRINRHPLESLIARFRMGLARDGRDWVLPLLVQGLATPLRQARITAYSSNCVDGGGPRTRWGTPVRVGIAAADPRYWGPGSVVWIGDPINYIVVIEDTGGKVKGEHRFDVCTGADAAMARRIGVRTVNYVPLYRAEPIAARRWGRKPANWRPSVEIPSAPPTADTEGTVALRPGGPDLQPKS